MTPPHCPADMDGTRKLKALKERRDHIQASIREQEDRLFIIDHEIAELEAFHG